MALINCPECGREKVSDSAESCPACGYGIRAHFERVNQEEQRKYSEEIECLEENQLEHEEILEESPDECKTITQNKLKEVQLQKEALIKQLESDRKYEIKATACVTVWSVIWSIICIYIFWSGKEYLMTIGVIALIFAAIGWFLLYTFGGGAKQKANDIEIAKRSLEEYKRLENDRLEYMRMQLKEKREQDAERERISHPTCPNCGSHNTNRISTANRAVSVATVGLASGKIGKQYQCKNCKHMW